VAAVLAQNPDGYRVGMTGWRRVLAVLLAAVGLTTLTAPSVVEAATRQPTPANLRAELLGDAEQVVVVSAPSWRSTIASVSMFQKVGSTWVRVAGPLPARVGRRGISRTHHEGDGTTPAGSFDITGALGRSATAGTLLPYTQIVSDSCWISDSGRADYNQLVSETPCSAPNENLARIARSGPYRRLITTGYNTSPVVPGAGSAIFLHVHHYRRSGGTYPTSGCVSLTSRNLNRLWSRLDPAKHPRVIIGKTSWLLA
jgi:L,D-peptidoglycan transpeptidase YkuD (ErfK/YbiS/YcfS/YnhG family)